MTLIEIRTCRNNLIKIRKARQLICDILIPDGCGRGSDKRLDTVNKHLEIFEEEMYNLISAEEIKFIKNKTS